MSKTDRYREYRVAWEPTPEASSSRYPMAVWGVVFGIFAGLIPGLIAFLSYNDWRNGRSDKPTGAIIVGWAGVVLAVLFAVFLVLSTPV